MKLNRLPEAVERYVEQIGLVWESQGLSRISGRIVGLLTLHDRPLSLDEIAELLGVSKGSVSQDTRRLAAMGLLEKQAPSVPGDRRDYYVIAHDLPVALIAQRITEIERIQRSLEAAAAVPETPPRVRERLARFGRFNRRVVASLRDISASLDDESAPLSTSALHAP